MFRSLGVQQFGCLGVRAFGVLGVQVMRGFRCLGVWGCGGS